MSPDLQLCCEAVLICRSLGSILISFGHKWVKHAYLANDYIVVRALEYSSINLKASSRPGIPTRVRSRFTVTPNEPCRVQ